MSGQELKFGAAKLAEQDTPQGVHVNATWPSLITWAVGRFGAGILLALAACWWAYRIDERAAVREDALLEAYRESTATQAETRDAIRALSYRTELNTAAVADLYRIQGRKLDQSRGGGEGSVREAN